MLSYRLGTVNYCHWWFKPVLSYSKLHIFSKYFGEEKEKMYLLSPPGHLEAEQNDRKVKRSNMYMKVVKKKENHKYKHLLDINQYMRYKLSLFLEYNYFTPTIQNKTVLNTLKCISAFLLVIPTFQKSINLNNLIMLYCQFFLFSPFTGHIYP